MMAWERRATMAPEHITGLLGPLTERFREPGSGSPRAQALQVSDSSLDGEGP